MVKVSNIAVIPPATTTNVISLPTPSSSSTVQTSSSTLSSVSSSSSSTTTSTTTSSALPTTTSTTPVVVTTTSSTPELITTMPTQTAMVTVSVTRSTSSFTSAAASASSTPAASSGTSTGAVVGGIGAGIVAIAALVFAVTFFIRRSRKRDNDGGFDEQDFRRSAVMLNDPPTHDDTVARGFNPRPPTMIERHLASPAPTFGTQYGYPGPAYNHDSVGYPESYAGYAASFQSFAPGQVMNNAPSPMTPNSAYPLYPAAPSAQSPFSPVSPREQYQFENPHQPPVGAAAAYPVLTRQASSHSQSSEGQGQPGSPTVMRRESLPANDYVDLNRSSVSPYQAAQYVEISRRLNTEVPEGLHTAALERELPPLPPPKFSSDAADGVSPFADPASAPPSPGGQYAFDHRHLETSQEHTRPVSGESFGSQDQVAPLEFPVPPSPALTPTSRYRIDSLPPTLPEINVESRVSVGGYPMLGTGPGARSSDAVGGMLTATGSRFPTTPSPLASSFGMPSPPPAAATKSFDAGVVKSEQSAAVMGGEKKRNTVYSMYDPEDAYGGI
ncbi:hypothetical protein BDZ97DRAFT_120364 [Flammula alnicola]|nr:hypothetical protein BDZ97DRAFT_120364 [Flammula alnicola]